MESQAESNNNQSGFGETGLEARHDTIPSSPTGLSSVRDGGSLFLAHKCTTYCTHSFQARHHWLLKDPIHKYSVVLKRYHETTGCVVTGWFMSQRTLKKQKRLLSVAQYQDSHGLDHKHEFNLYESGCEQFNGRVE